MWVCGSADRMGQFLRFGVAGIGKGADECASLTPLPSDWLLFGPSDPKYPFDRRWLVPAMVGYYWSQVCRWREKHGYPVALPDVPKIMANLAPLLAKSTRWQVQAHLFVLTEWFDLIRYLAQPAGEMLVLGEDSLIHPLVKITLDEINSHGQTWFDTKMEEMQHRTSPVSPTGMPASPPAPAQSAAVERDSLPMGFDFAADADKVDADLRRLEQQALAARQSS